jgi:hypothetical protein
MQRDFAYGWNNLLGAIALVVHPLDGKIVD